MQRFSGRTATFLPKYVRSTADFYTAMDGAGFRRISAKGKRYFAGLRLKPDTDADEDFLS